VEAGALQIGLGGRLFLEQAAGLAVVFVDKPAGEPEVVGRIGWWWTVAELGFEFADAVFDGPVVAGIADGAVEGDDAVAVEEGIDLRGVEDAAIVPFEQQGRTVFPEETLQLMGGLVSVEVVGEQGFELVSGGQVLNDGMGEAMPGGIFGVFGAIDGPGGVGV
jgi:hypothetical protein